MGTPAVSVYLTEQETAGLDICTDGDAHYDPDVGGQSWTSYPLFHMAGFDRDPGQARGQHVGAPCSLLAVEDVGGRHGDDAYRDALVGERLLRRIDQGRVDLVADLLLNGRR